jgi:hypothetical protein
MAGAGTGTNVKCPVKMIHATNDWVSYKNSDTFWSGIPQQFKSSYEKPDGGGHYVWGNFLEPSTGIYEWIKSFSAPSEPDEIIDNPSIQWNKTKSLLIIEGITYKLTEQ